MRSLTAKLTLASLISSLISVLLVGLGARYFTGVVFDRYVQERSTDQVVQVVTDYYTTHGSWDGLDAVLHDLAPRPERPPPQRPPPPRDGRPPRPPPGFAPDDAPPPRDGMPPPRDGPPPPRYIVADARGCAATNGPGYQIGELVNASLLVRGTPISVAGVRVGTLVVLGARPPFDPREQEFLTRTNQALLAAMVGGGLSALMIAVALTRLLTRPIRALTTAIRAMHGGTLRQEVPTTAHDELGDLVRAFNHMSHDLAQATAARRQMTADIAHELRTPLSVLMGYIETLRDGTLPPSPARFQTMFVEAQQLQRLIDDLRLLALADAGELTLHPQPTDPRALLEASAAAFAPQAAQQQVTLHVATDADVPIIAVDPERMAQVLGNLINNALRYTPAGGSVTLDARAEDAGLRTEVASRVASVLSPRRSVRITVRDTGGGIAPDVLPHIFARLYRADAGRGADDGGSGLGLAISKAIVEAHGGTLSAASTLGRGTCMTMTFPLAANYRNPTSFLNSKR